MALIETLTEDFPGVAVDAAKWTVQSGTGGSVAVSGGLCRLNSSASASSYGQITGAAAWNGVLLGSSVYAKITPGATTNLDVVLTLVGSQADTYVTLRCTNGVMKWNTSGVPATLEAYNPATWVYWKISCTAGGVVTFGRSADAVTWTTFTPGASIATINSPTHLIRVYAQSTVGGAATTTTINSFNMLPADDLTAPTTPGTPAVSNGTSTSLTLTWTGSTDAVGVTAYRVYKDAVLYATTASVFGTITARTLPTSANWDAVGYGNGVFVAVAFNSAIAASSPDGVTWTQRVLPTANWNAVAYGNGVFAAVASATTIAATSPDGVTWTQRTISAGMQAVAFGNGLFVAVAYNSTAAATSPDGITWTARTLPATAGWAQIAYGNGVFTAVALGSAIAATSPDGITWTQRALPTSASWFAVAYGNGVFTAVAQNSTIAATSPDGVTWTQRVLPATSSWRAIAYGNGLFAAVASGSTVAATSPDGVTWTQRTSTAGMQAVAYGAGAFVAVAYNSTAAMSAPVAPALTADVTGLTAGALHSFTVKAIDAAGNESSPSAAVQYGASPQSSMSML